MLVKDWGCPRLYGKYYSKNLLASVRTLRSYFVDLLSFRNEIEAVVGKQYELYQGIVTPNISFRDWVQLLPLCALWP